MRSPGSPWTVTRAQVADRAGQQRDDAAEADAHAAAGREQDARGLAGVEQGGGDGVDGAVAAGVGDGSAGARRHDPRGEALGGQRQSGRAPVLLEGVQQAGGPARPRGPGAPVRDEVVELGGPQQAVGVGVPLEEGQPGHAAQLRAEQDVVAGERAVQQDDVGQRPALGQLAEHPHDGREAAAGGHHEHLRGQGVGQHEVARGLVEPQDVAGADRPGEVVRDDAVRDRLHGDPDRAVGPGRTGEGVRAAVPDAVDADADPDPLAGAVPGPAAAGLQHERGGAGGLAPHVDDAGPEVDRAVEGVDQAEVVGREQRGADGQGQPRECVHDIECTRSDVTWQEEGRCDM